jgi:phage anti-repressor protein/uncharacterized C2H2 Zn-finger protein
MRNFFRKKIYVKDKSIKLLQMNNELEIIAKAIDVKDIEEFTHLDLAKLAGFNEKELKMVEIFWDAAYNKSWIYLSSELIHEYLGYKKTNSSVNDFYRIMKSQFTNEIDYKEVSKDHEIVKYFEKFYHGLGHSKEKRGGALKKYYIVTGETLKMMAMMANTTKGRETRNYFLKVEGLCSLMSKYIVEKVKQEAIKQKEEANEKLLKQQEEAAAQLAKQMELLKISESKNLNLTSSILNEKLHTVNGYVYLATCKQYSSLNHYRFGKTNDLKKRLATYQVGRTDKDLMYYAFVFESECVELLELIIRRWLKDFRHNPKKDIYVLPWPVISEFITNICKQFHNSMVPSVNKMIRDNLDLASSEAIVPPVTDISIYDETVEEIYESEVSESGEEQEETDEDYDSEESTEDTLVIVKKPHPVIRNRRRDPLQCIKCGRIFNNLFNYNRHANAITQCDEIIKCGRCDKEFINMSKFRRHCDRATLCY